VQYLKIDGEFVGNLPGSTDDRVCAGVLSRQAAAAPAHRLRQDLAEIVR